MSLKGRWRSLKIRRLEDEIADLSFDIATRGPISLPSRVRQVQEYRDRLQKKLDALTGGGHC